MDELLIELKIFLSSTKELHEEKKIIEKICEEHNDNKTFDEIRFRVLKHERDTMIGDGTRPQEDINPLIKECHLFVLLLWKRFGSHTGKDESGIKEEYDYAVLLNKKSQKPKIIIFDRKDEYYINDKDECEQLCKLILFKEEVGKYKYINQYKGFDGKEGFESIFRKKLTDFVKEFIKKPKSRKLYNDSHFESLNFYEGTQEISLNEEKRFQTLSEMGVKILKKLDVVHELKLIHEINFDYLPDSPFNQKNGWNTDPQYHDIKFHEGEFIANSKSIILNSVSNHAMFYDKIPDSIANKCKIVEFIIRIDFIEKRAFYIKLDQGNKDRETFLNIRKLTDELKEPKPNRTSDWNFEWLIPIEPTPIRDGWENYKIDIEKEFKRSFGRPNPEKGYPNGFPFTRLKGIRLRPNMQIAIIRFFG
jgi:hypothetical protein